MDNCKVRSSMGAYAGSAHRKHSLHIDLLCETRSEGQQEIRYVQFLKKMAKCRIFRLYLVVVTAYTGEELSEFTLCVQHSLVFLCTLTDQTVQFLL